MGNTIKGNVGELFVLSTGEIKEPKNLDKFHPQSNVNILVINIEGIPQEKTMAQINFAPTNKSGWASVWFPLNRKGVLHHKLENEDEYRTFTQYTIQVPEPITTLNLNNSSALNVGITFRHIGGIDFLGAYETIQDLIAEYPPYQDLNEMLAIAYVYGTTNYGFYQVVFDNGVYVWRQTPSPIAQLQIKPYNMGNIQIQGGYGTRTPIQSIADSQYNIIWLELNTIASRLDHFYDKEHIDTAFLEKYTTPTGDNDVFSIYGITAQGQQAIYQASVENYDNTIVVRDGVGRIKDLDKHNISSEAHSNEFNKKVDKTQTIIGLDLQDNILLSEFKQALGEATQSAAGLLSAEDKTHLDGLVALLETNDDNNVVDTIGEILAIFQNYPEGAELVTILQGKVDKVVGKGLSTNDFTNNDKNKLDGIEAGAEVNEVNSVNGKQGVVVLNQDDIGDGATYKQVSQAEKNTWNEKQDKLTAGDNITIDENNVISASGVDLNTTAYFNYASRIYGDKYSLLKNAWEHSLTVVTVNKNNYPNGETEGVIIPHGVTSIGAHAFVMWSSNNQPLIIPNSVTSIGEGAFQTWSSNNQPLTIPNSVTSIGAGSFYGWSANNQPLIIPNSVTSIGDSAFNGWTLVPYVEIQAITPPTLANANAFNNQNNAPIYVPDESVDYYKTAPKWADLADRIFPMSDKLVGGSIDEVDGATTPIMLKTGSQETLDEDDTLKERELVYSSDKNIFGIYYDNKIRWQGVPLVIEPIIRVRNFGASDSKLSYVGMSPTLRLLQDGDINYYTNDIFDTLYPFKDMKEVEDDKGNKFIEIPPFYVKYIVDENDIITGYDIANYKVDEDYGISPAFIDVISGEVKPLWFGKYMANVDGSDKMTSKSGVMATAEQTLGWFRQRAINNGLGYYQNSLYTWQIVQMLVWTYFGSINSDDFFPDINYGSYLNNGQMDNVPYKVAYNSTTGKNTFFGIENILKEKRHFIDGVLLNIPNMYVAKDFRKFATDTTTNYDLVSTSLPTSSGFIVSMAFENGVMYPKVVSGGSDGTYFADYYYQGTGNRILYGGSSRGSAAGYGLSSWNGANASSYSTAALGSRLMYSPLTPTE